MNSIHFMYVPFTGLGLKGGYRGDEWLKRRIKVFKNFVLRSLTNQSKQEFIIWASWRPEERTNPLVQDLRRSMDQLRGITTVFTFGGLCFYDDKYEDSVAKERLLNNLSATLPELASYIPEDTEHVYMTIQPSDDMYIRDFVKEVHENWPPHMEAMGFEKGYIINYATKELAEYNPDTNPPFFTIRFTREQFLDPQLHFDHTGPYESHEYVGKYLKYGTWKERGFIVGTHGANISTTFEHPYKGAVLLDGEKDAILLASGIYFADTIHIPKTLRLQIRTLFNSLPMNDLLRNFYKKLPVCLQRF